MLRMKAAFGVPFLVLCAVLCQGQIPDTMTNTAVADYVMIGIDDKSVIEEIRNAKDTAFDLSPEGIKALKAQKVSDAVIEAMKEKQAAVNQFEAAGLPFFSGLYCKPQDTWRSVGKVLVSEQDTGETSKGLSVGSSNHTKVKHHYKYKYNNKSAGLQIKGPRPTFYLRQEQASQDFEQLTVIRVEQKKDFRQVEWWTITDGQTTTMAPENPVVIKVQAKRLRDDIVAYTPESDLNPGEYLMYGNNIGYAYEFGVVE